MSEVRLVHEYSMSGWKMRCTCGMQVECAWCVREVCLVRVALKEYGALLLTGPKSSKQIGCAWRVREVCLVYE